MAEALCGPTNALQRFQKQTSLDRTLQRDRLNLYPHPEQRFRSSPSSSSSILDSEFRTFQSESNLSGLAVPSLKGASLQHSSRVPPKVPSWASDFQNLSLNHSTYSPSSVPSDRKQTQYHVTSSGDWQHEFLSSQEHQGPSEIPLLHGLTGKPPQAFIQQFPSPCASSTYTTSFAQRQGKQFIPALQSDHFDDAAFASAFDAVQQEVEQLPPTSKGKERAPPKEHLDFHLRHACTDPGDVLGEYDFDAVRDSVNELSNTVDELRSMRRDAGWEAVEAYKRAHEREIEQTNSQRSRDIVNAIKSMRAEEKAGLQKLEIEQVRIGADTIPAQTEDSQNRDAEADALSQTAGQLLNNLKDEKNDKFVQSNFMELMRRLRDKEVQVEGDKMVNVSTRSDA